MGFLSTLLSISFISLLGALSPGPDFFVVVKNSLSHSRKAGFWTAFGISTALIIHLSYTLVGIGALIASSEWIYQLIKYIGAGYLVYIGSKGCISSFKEQKSPVLTSSEGCFAISNRMAFKQGFFTNLLNPKCALFFVSLFSQFIVINTPTTLKIGYAFVNWSITLIWFLFLAYLLTANFMIARAHRFRIYIDRIMGAALILLGLRMLLS